MNPYLHIFGKEIPVYGLLFMFGLLFGGFMSNLRKKHRNLPKMDVIYCSCFAGIGGIIGAKVLSIITSIDIIISYSLSLIDIISNGFVFYGGLIGGFFGILIYCKIYKLPYSDFLDVFAISVPLGHAFGRLGCLASGCCFGIPYDGFFSITYTTAVDINTPLNTPLLAIQLIEAVCLLLLYGTLEIVFYKTNRKGLCAKIYALSYAILRIVLENFRGDLARGFLFGLSTSQWISIMIILTVIGLQTYTYITKKLRNKRI